MGHPGASLVAGPTCLPCMTSQLTHVCPAQGWLREPICMHSVPESAPFTPMHPCEMHEGFIRVHFCITKLHSRTTICAPLPHYPSYAGVSLRAGADPCDSFFRHAFLHLPPHTHTFCLQKSPKKSSKMPCARSSTSTDLPKILLRGPEHFRLWDQRRHCGFWRD